MNGLCRSGLIGLGGKSHIFTMRLLSPCAWRGVLAIVLAPFQDESMVGRSLATKEGRLLKTHALQHLVDALRGERADAVHELRSRYRGHL